LAAIALHKSAFGGKADMAWCTCLVKQTPPFATGRLAITVSVN